MPYAYRDHYPIGRLPDHARGLSDRALATLDPPIYHVRELVPEHDPATHAVVREYQGPPGYDDSGPIPVVTVAYGIRALSPEEIVANEDAAKGPVPETVTKLQLVRAMRDADAWNDTKAWIATLPDDAQEDWSLVNVIPRTDPLVADARDALGWTDAQVDDLFRAAALL